MLFTAERVIPDRLELKPMLQEHMARYSFAEPFVEGAVVLDAGCGCGYGSYHLAKAGAKRVIGVDVAPEAIEYARAHYDVPNLDFEVMDLMDMPIPNEMFDAIVCLEVFEHVETQGRLLTEACRVLKPGGQILVSTPNKQIFSPRQKHPINYWHVREFDRDEFVTMLTSSFQDVRLWGQTTSTPGIVPFILFNLRVQRYLLTHKSRLTSVLRYVYEGAMKASMLPMRLFPGMMSKDPNIIIEADRLPLDRTLYFVAVGRKPWEQQLVGNPGTVS